MKKMGEAAREACAVGLSDEAGVKIDKLMQLLNLATNLVAAAPPLDHPATGVLPEGSPNAGYSTVTSSSNSRVSPPTGPPPGLVLPFQSDPGITRVSSTGSMKMDTMDLGNHESRKRCASSVPIGDDRANKAPKREPLEDIIPLAQHTPPSAHHTPPLLQGNIFQSQQQQHAVPGVADPRTVAVFASANTLSQPLSRPPSPPKLIEGFNLTQQQQPPQISSPSKTPPQSDFDSNSSTPTATVSAFPTGSGNRSSWSDGPPSILPQRQHPHSRSASSLVDLHGLGIPSYSSPTFAPPALQSSQHPGVNTGGSSISPPLGRVSRTGSVSNGFVSPFAFGFSDVATAVAPAAVATPLGRPAPPVAGPSTVEAYDYSKSRPSTATMARRNSDTEEDYFDDDSDDEDGSSPSSRDFRSRPNTSHGGSGGSSGQHGGTDGSNSSHHRDDVPQEYREEVDRVFFEFMNKICSNRRPMTFFWYVEG
jgi:hypothetical protein